MSSRTSARRPEAAEADLSAARDEIARLGTELSRAHAKLEDRASFAAMFRADALKPGPTAKSEGNGAASHADATTDKDGNGGGDGGTPSGRSAAKDRSPPRKNSRSKPVAGAVDGVSPSPDEPLTGTLPIPASVPPNPLTLTVPPNDDGAFLDLVGMQRAARSGLSAVLTS